MTAEKRASDGTPLSSAHLRPINALNSFSFSPARYYSYLTFSYPVTFTPYYYLLLLLLHSALCSLSPIVPTGIHCPDCQGPHSLTTNTSMELFSVQYYCFSGSLYFLLLLPLPPAKLINPKLMIFRPNYVTLATSYTHTLSILYSSASSSLAAIDAYFLRSQQLWERIPTTSQTFMYPPPPNNHSLFLK